MDDSKEKYMSPYAAECGTHYPSWMRDSVNHTVEMRESMLSYLKDPAMKMRNMARFSGESIYCAGQNKGYGKEE